MTASKKQRVAIVGGGCGAMAAALELSRPEMEGRFEITVYQLGWRLGGKGASGRGAAGRIEEHGLHVWLGFYENAFRLLRECYAELDRSPAECPIAGWRDAFFPDPQVALAGQSLQGGWTSWSALFPPAPGAPGDPLTTHNPFTVQSYLKHTAALLTTLLVGYRLRREVLRVELYRETADFFSLWRGCLRYIAPPVILVIMLAASIELL